MTTGGDTSSLDNMDGMDMWKALSTNQPSPRNLMLHNIDNQRFISALRLDIEDLHAPQH